MPWILFYNGDWTWVKMVDKPKEEIRNTLKQRWGARFGRRKLAWYIEQHVPEERLVEVLGEPIGVVRDRPPTKTWDYCLGLAQ